MEHQSPAVAPLTPSWRTERHGAPRVTRVEIKMILDDLTRTWDLRLEMPPENESPSKRLGRPQTPEQRCVALITALSYKNYHVEPITSFKKIAKLLWSGWMLKPKGEKDVIPRATRDREHSLTNSERKLMIDLLLTHLEGPGEELKEKNKTPRHRRSTSDSDGTPLFKDDPIAFPLSTPDPKRAREEPVSGAEKSTKKCKFPETRPTPLSKGDPNAMLPPDWGRQSFKDTGGYRSANTSFGSISGSSVFSVNQSFGYPMLPDTQETVPDLAEQSFQKTQEFSNAASTKSSDYGAGSSFDADLINAVDSNALLLDAHVDTERAEASISSQLDGFGIQSFNMLTDEDILQERLEHVFPKLPPSLEKAPLHVIYEITRVFSHAEVSWSGIRFPNASAFSDYTTLWSFLRQLPDLQGKPFPEKSEKSAWEAANNDYTFKGSAVVLGGTLKYNASSETGPLFQFRLKPMTLERRHRLGRKLGDDRFLEIDMPHLKGNEVPKIIQDERGHEILLKWLVDGPHWLFGRSWKPFHCKPKESKTKQEKKKDKKEKKEKKKAEISHCVYFFAVSGNGLSPRYHSQEESIRPTIEIGELLTGHVRITRKNKHQPYLKLFSRTSLALSRNTPTLQFERSQIRYKEDIEFKGENMTDGAGRISYAAALEVMKQLGLSYPASGFQGRIGEAKGFWSVDHSSKSGDIWIEVYASQCKWVRTRNKSRTIPDNDVENRTFEVLHPSGPLKSADLNLQFLPLLVDRARDKDIMKKTLQNLLEVGLQSELDDLLTAMGDAPTLRKWVHETNPNDQQRIKFGQVKYEAGLPTLQSEKLIMLLDAGFETNKFQYAMELCRTLFASKCSELKQRLNITVGKSTYAYMVPDFWGVLAEDEVYMDFSTFTDEVTGLSGESLHGRDLLVARSPAHFVSDIQKVKAVAKVELIGLKDVIIFPTKGKPSLAAKLSGGDYDGDIAWVCWEESIVDNFVTAPVPPTPDLVKDGFITKDATKYEDLVDGLENPVSHFLKRSLSFNMQQNMLGICTAWKDSFCYNQGSVASEEATTVSQLLSSLVDQAKQGYSFTEDDWKRLRDKLVAGKTFRIMQPEYKKDEPHFKSSAKHIIDYLMWVAYDKVDKSLAEFESNIKAADIPTWDEDLLQFSRWAGDASLKNTEWRTILTDLNKDLETIKASWSKTWVSKINSSEDHDSTGRSETILEFYDQYTAILPHDETPLVHLLLSSYGPPDHSPWALLKASVLFGSYSKTNARSFAWQMAGKQLAHLKALQNGDGAPHSVVPGIYSIYKPNNGMIKKLQTQNLTLTENVGVSNMDEFDAVVGDQL